MWGCTFFPVSSFLKPFPFAILHDEHNKVNKHMSELHDGQTYFSLKAFSFLLLGSICLFCWYAPFLCRCYLAATSQVYSSKVFSYVQGNKNVLREVLGESRIQWTSWPIASQHSPWSEGQIREIYIQICDPSGLHNIVDFIFGRQLRRGNLHWTSS